MKRILLKLSGEFLQGNKETLSEEKLQKLIPQLAELQAAGIQIGIVIGGGNIFRGGRNTFKLDRLAGDHIGMAATCVNALFLQAFLELSQLSTRVYGSCFTGESILPYDIYQARKDLSQGSIVIFAGGTGHAFFSTDTAAALRAIEMKSDVLLKATRVSGVYDKDPLRFKDAKKFDTLTYQQAEKGRYGIMDTCAFTLCREQKMPIFIFNLDEDRAIIRAVQGQIEGTFIKE